MMLRFRGWLVFSWTWVVGALGFRSLATPAFRRPAIQCVEAPVESYSGGATWSDLPPELVEQILANCSMVELARLARTCKAFRAAFRREMGREQQARHKLALESFGRERIKCIVDLVDRYLKGQPLHPEVDVDDLSVCSISVDGALHFEGSGKEVFIPVSSPRIRELGDILVHVEFPYEMPCSMFLEVAEPSFGKFGLKVSRGEETCFYVESGADGDVRSVALVQALLTGDLPDSQADLPNPHSVLAPPFRVAAQPVSLEITMKTPTNRALTRAAMRALIGPLLPLATRYNLLAKSISAPMKCGWFGGSYPWGVFIKGQVQPRAVESHANSGIMLHGIMTRPNDP